MRNENGIYFLIGFFFKKSFSFPRGPLLFDYQGSTEKFREIGRVFRERKPAGFERISGFVVNFLDKTCQDFRHSEGIKVCYCIDIQYFILMVCFLIQSGL